MKYWIYILDEPDTFSVVDMIEHSGTAYLPQLDEMLLSKYPSLELSEEGDEYPRLFDISTASEIDDKFEELMQASIDELSDEDYQLKRKIIYDALENE